MCSSKENWPDNVQDSLYGLEGEIFNTLPPGSWARGKSRRASITDHSLDTFIDCRHFLFLSDTVCSYLVSPPHLLIFPSSVCFFWAKLRLSITLHKFSVVFHYRKHHLKKIMARPPPIVLISAHSFIHDLETGFEKREDLNFNLEGTALVFMHHLGGHRVPLTFPRLICKWSNSCLRKS